MLKNYSVQLNLLAYDEEDEEYTVPVITTIGLEGAMWRLFSEEQIKEELTEFAIKQLNDVGVIIDRERLESVDISEIEQSDTNNEN